jgi:hypothetical protein
MQPPIYFVALKSNQDEADLDRAMHVGVPTEDGLIEGNIRFEIVTAFLSGIAMDAIIHY